MAETETATIPMTPEEIISRVLNRIEHNDASVINMPDIDNIDQKCLTKLFDYLFPDVFYHGLYYYSNEHIFMACITSLHKFILPDDVLKALIDSIMYKPGNHRATYVMHRRRRKININEPAYYKAFRKICDHNKETAYPLLETHVLRIIDNNLVKYRYAALYPLIPVEMYHRIVLTLDKSVKYFNDGIYAMDFVYAILDEDVDTAVLIDNKFNARFFKTFEGSDFYRINYVSASGSIQNTYIFKKLLSNKMERVAIRSLLSNGIITQNTEGYNFRYNALYEIFADE